MRKPALKNTTIISLAGRDLEGGTWLEHNEWPEGPSKFRRGSRRVLADLPGKVIASAEWGRDQDKDTIVRLKFSDGTFIHIGGDCLTGTALPALNAEARLTGKEYKRS